jgi:hypothetical protein
VLTPLNVESLDHIFLLIIHLSSRLSVITGMLFSESGDSSSGLAVTWLGLCYDNFCNVTITNMQCP